MPSPPKSISSPEYVPSARQRVVPGAKSLVAASSRDDAEVKTTSQLISGTLSSKARGLTTKFPPKVSSLAPSFNNIEIIGIRYDLPSFAPTLVEVKPAAIINTTKSLNERI